MASMSPSPTLVATAVLLRRMDATAGGKGVAGDRHDDPAILGRTLASPVSGADGQVRRLPAESDDLGLDWQGARGWATHQERAVLVADDLSEMIAPRARVDVDLAAQRTDDPTEFDVPALAPRRQPGHDQPFFSLGYTMAAVGSDKKGQRAPRRAAKVPSLTGALWERVPPAAATTP